MFLFAIFFLAIYTFLMHLLLFYHRFFFISRKYILCIFQLSFSPTTPKAMHMKLLTLLGLILVSCMGLLGICALIGLQAGFTFFAFMAAEVNICF
jgi:hypothetical protein